MALFVLLSLYETVLTLAHTLSAAIRHRNVRYLLAATAAGPEGMVPIL